MMDKPRNLFSKSAKAANTASENAAIIGFQTQQRSFYKFDPAKGLTERFKLSGGYGQGAWQSQKMCLFADSEKLEDARVDLQETKHSVRLGYEKDGAYTALVKNVIDIPLGAKPLVMFLEKETSTLLRAVPAQITRALNMAPLRNYICLPAKASRITDIR